MLSMILSVSGVSSVCALAHASLYSFIDMPLCPGVYMSFTVLNMMILVHIASIVAFMSPLPWQWLPFIACSIILIPVWQSEHMRTRRVEHPAPYLSIRVPR